MPGKTAPPRSPEREALAAAIERHNNAVRNLDVTKRALDEARGRSLAEAVTKARADVETAKVNAAAHMTETLLGKAADAPVSIKEARRALQEVEDELEALHAIQATLEKRLQDCREEKDWAKQLLDRALRDVIKAEPPVRQLLTKFKAVQADLEQRRFDLFWLWRNDMIPDEFKDWNMEERTVEPGPDDLSVGTAPWKAALDELASNSDAPLPAV
jgi:chromosome segregation ATPase